MCVLLQYTYKENAQKDQMLEPHDARGQEACNSTIKLLWGTDGINGIMHLHIGTSEIIQTAIVLVLHMTIKTA